MEVRRGFTMIESLIVLVITILTLGLGLFIKDSFQTEPLDQIYFWRQFQSRFDLLESISEKQRRLTSISFLTPKRVVFSIKNKDILLKVPQGLWVKRTPFIIRIGRNGNVKPQRIQWGNSQGRTINQIFELGWGVYRVEK